MCYWKQALAAARDEYAGPSKVVDWAFLDLPRELTSIYYLKIMCICIDTSLYTHDNLFRNSGMSSIILTNFEVWNFNLWPSKPFKILIVTDSFQKTFHCTFVLTKEMELKS